MGTLGTTAVAFGITCVLAPVLLVVLRRRAVLDHPTDRSSHEAPTPRGLGAALAIAGLVALAVSDLSGPTAVALAFGAGGFALVGAVEDMRGVPPAPRFALQTAVAVATLTWLLKDFTGSTLWLLAIAAAVVVWLVAFVNAFNFMDGINGISVGEASVAGAAFAIVGSARNVHVLTVGGLILLAVAMAFAPMNYPRALGFMGDAGSYFLGGWIAVLTVIALRTHIPAEAVLGATIIYVADTSTTLIRRVRNGEPWWEPHRNHTYQRLTIAGWSHEMTTAFVAALALVCAMLGSFSVGGSTAVRAAADAAIAFIVIGYLAAPPFVKKRKAYR